MKKLFLAAFIALAFLGSLFGLPKVAVLDIIAQKGIDPSVVVPVTESIMEEVVGTRAYVVLDRAYIEQVLKEQEFDVSAMVSDTQVAKAGQYVGADYVVTGKVQLLGTAYFLVAKMIEVRTGVIVSQSSAQGAGELTTLLDMSRSIGKKLVAGAPISPLEPSGAAAAGAAAAAGSRAMPATAAGAGKKIKAGFVMPPWGRLDYADQSWSSAVIRVRREYADWLDTVVAEEVDPARVDAVLDKLADQDKCDIILACFFDLSDAFVAASRRHPDVIFEAWNGEFVRDRDPNLGISWIDWQWHLYLQGLVAGSMSGNRKIGFITWPPAADPEAVAKLNMFALGVKASASKATVVASFLPNRFWENPESKKTATRALLAQGCDFIAGEDSNEVYEVLDAWAKSGKRVLSFHNEISYTWKPGIIASGPMHDFSVFFRRPLLALHEGAWKKEGFSSKDVMAFGGGGPPFNPAFMPELRAKSVMTPDLGEVPLLDLVGKRVEQIKSDEFEPFTGPIKDQKGKLRLAAGMRKPSWEFLMNMDWLLDNVKGTIPGR